MKYSHIEAVLFDLGGVRKAVAAQPNNGEIRVHLGIAHSLASTRPRRPIFPTSTRDHRLAIG